MQIQGGMFDALDIAISGLKAHGKNLEIIGSNVANARTTDAGNGQPYRRMEVLFKASEDKDAPGVEVSDVVADQSDFERILNPGHPDADADGYVSMPNVQLPMELINLNTASRGYQANAAILKRYQKMVESSMELLK